VAFYACLLLICMVNVNLSCFILGKRKQYIQQQCFPGIQDVMACNGDVPKVTMGNSSWLCGVCSCIHGKSVLQRMAVCMSAWHCVICTVQSVCCLQDCIAVFAAVTLHSQLIFLLYSGPQRNEHNIGKQ